MTLTPMTPDFTEQVELAAYRLANATVAYIARLKDLVDITTLSTGDHGFDFAVGVNSADKPAVLLQLADLTFDIESQYGVSIRTLAMSDGTCQRKPVGGA